MLQLQLSYFKATALARPQDPIRVGCIQQVSLHFDAVELTYLKELCCRDALEWAHALAHAATKRRRAAWARGTSAAAACGWLHRY